MHARPAIFIIIHIHKNSTAEQKWTVGTGHDIQYSIWISTTKWRHLYLHAVYSLLMIYKKCDKPVGY